jgi:hypothetical protein
MREMGHLVRESQMVACRGGRGLVGVGAPGSRRLDKRRGVKRGKVKLGRSVGGRDDNVSHVFRNM